MRFNRPHEQGTWDNNTFASWPNSLLKMPMEPGPQTSCVIKISTLTQTFSPGISDGHSEALASIFSVMVIAVFTYNHLIANRTRRIQQITDRTKEISSKSRKPNWACRGRSALRPLRSHDWHDSLGKWSLAFCGREAEIFLLRFAQVPTFRNGTVITRISTQKREREMNAD